MGDNGSVADMARGCSVGSQELSLKCHFRLRQAGEPCKNQVQAEGKVSLDHPQPPGTTSRTICSHREPCTGHSFPWGLCLGAPCLWHPLDIWVCVWVYHACSRAGIF